MLSNINNTNTHSPKTSAIAEHANQATATSARSQHAIATMAPASKSQAYLKFLARLIARDLANKISEENKIFEGIPP